MYIIKTLTNIVNMISGKKNKEPNHALQGKYSVFRDKFRLRLNWEEYIDS